MHHPAGGSFWGYRELPPIIVNKPRLRPPGRTLGIPKLDPVQMDNMGWPSIGNLTFPGYTSDDFEDWVMFGDYVNPPIEVLFSRHIALWLEGGWVEISYTFDGETALETRVVTQSYRAVEAARGFRIRSYMPGWSVWYELMVFY